MTDQRSQPDALPDADADDSAIEQVGTAGPAHPSTDIDDLGIAASDSAIAGMAGSGKVAQ